MRSWKKSYDLIDPSRAHNSRAATHAPETRAITGRVKVICLTGVTHLHRPEYALLLLCSGENVWRSESTYVSMSLCPSRNERQKSSLENELVRHLQCACIILHQGKDRTDATVSQVALYSNAVLRKTTWETQVAEHSPRSRAIARVHWKQLQQLKLLKIDLSSVAIRWANSFSPCVIGRMYS